jgi:hypothetical protein
VNHNLTGTAGDYDRLCLQTRILTLRNILSAMGQKDLIRRLLNDQSAWEKAARQSPDTLVDAEVPS